MPKAPEAEIRKVSHPLIEALSNYRPIHVEAYVVLVDLLLQIGVEFKLTPDSIDSFIEYHEDVHCMDSSANGIYDGPDKNLIVKKLHGNFVFRTPASPVLESLDPDGSGELLCGKSREVKDKIMALFLPLFPPSPIVDMSFRPSDFPTFRATAKSQMIPNINPYMDVELWRQIAAFISTSHDESCIFQSKASSPDTRLPLPSLLIAQRGINVFAGPKPRLCEAV
jgi:hypothetical protein